jgi:GR25 family glycosyltransferase involved in LPS biosynthesis
LGLDITVLNGGCGGATILHSLNVFLNKLIPIKPVAVILMTGIVDVDVAYLKASYWSHDCWVEPIVDTSTTNTWRDNERLPCPSFDDRMKMLNILAAAGKLFDIPIWYATVPHRQVFGGEYVQKAFSNKADFDRQVDARKQMNDVTRLAAVSAGLPLFDLELELRARSDIFHDMFHLNSLGGEAVARAFVKCGIDELLGVRKVSADATIQHLPALLGDYQCSAIRSIAPARETLATLEQMALINQPGRPAGLVPSAQPVLGEVESAIARHHHSQIAASGRAAGVEPEVEPSLLPVRNGLGKNEGGTNELPRMHLINLDRSPERLLRFRDHNDHLREIVRVSATDGAKVDREALVSSGYINRDLPYSDGTLGCAVSHIKLWEMAASQDRNLTIFEDDVVVSLHFEARAREILAAVPADWDFIQWGVTFDPLFVWVDLGVSKARLHPYGTRNYAVPSDYKRFQAEKLFPAPLRLLHSFGLQGYSISAKGARAALEYCLPLRNRSIEFPEAEVTTRDRGIDVALCGLFPTLKAYVCFPQLLVPNDGESVRKSIDREGEAGPVGKAIGAMLDMDHPAHNPARAALL